MVNKLNPLHLALRGRQAIALGIALMSVTGCAKFNQVMKSLSQGGKGSTSTPSANAQSSVNPSAATVELKGDQSIVGQKVTCDAEGHCQGTALTANPPDPRP